jgi:hypothetical protein
MSFVNCPVTFALLINILPLHYVSKLTCECVAYHVDVG